MEQVSSLSESEEDSSSQSSDTEEEEEEEVPQNKKNWSDTGIPSTPLNNEQGIAEPDGSISASIKASEQKESFVEEVHKSIQHPVVGKSTFNLHESLHNTIPGGLVRSKSA